MRFVIAIVAFVLAAAAIGLGVAQRTILAGPDSVVSSVTTGVAPYTVIDGATLNAHAGTQGIAVEGEGPVILAYGRTGDVLAWIGEDPYNEVTWDAEAGELVTRVVSAGSTPDDPTGDEEGSAVDPGAADNPGAADQSTSPAGSDLWLREFTGTDELTRRINAPANISVIIAADGVQPAPSDLSITWPLDNSAPFATALVIGGVVALLAGLVAFIWALLDLRGRHGPRRSTRKLPKPPKPPRLKPRKNPRDPEDGPSPVPELEAAAPSRSGRRRAFVAAVGVGAALLTGCSSAPAAPVPTPTSTDAVSSVPVAVTEGQFSSILVDVVAAVADADAAGDTGLAATRLSGPALALRTANYAIRAVDSSVAALPAIPDDVVEITLPEQGEAWPRSIFAVTRDEGGAAVGMMLTQESARANYRVAYLMTLVADVPDVAPPEIGAPELPPGNELGLLAPDELAAAYGDILIHGEDSDSFQLFQGEGDPLRAAIGVERKAERRAALPASATIEFSNGPGVDPVIAFGTNDSGQIVAAILDDVETVRPVEAGAAVNPSGQVKALSGLTQSTRGVIATYGVQLLLYIPPAGSDGRIVLLGYAQGLVSATEVP